MKCRLSRYASLMDLNSGSSARRIWIKDDLLIRTWFYFFGRRICDILHPNRLLPCFQIRNSLYFLSSSARFHFHILTPSLLRTFFSLQSIDHIGFVSPYHLKFDKLHLFSQIDRYPCSCTHLDGKFLPIEDNFSLFPPSMQKKAAIESDKRFFASLFLLRIQTAT